MNTNLPAERSSGVEADPIANPGLPAHTWRPTDVDPRAEKRAERQVALLFALSALCTIGFIVAYFALQIGECGDTVLGLGASTVALGLLMSGAFLFIGIGIIQWARKLMSDHEITEDRHPAASPKEDRDATLRRCRQAWTSPASAGAPSSATPCSARSAWSDWRPSSCSATSDRCPATR